MNDELEMMEGNVQVLVPILGGTRENHEKPYSIHG
jgi:hypothetical protein